MYPLIKSFSLWPIRIECQRSTNLDTSEPSRGPRAPRAPRTDRDVPPTRVSPFLIACSNKASFQELTLGFSSKHPFTKPKISRPSGSNYRPCKLPSQCDVPSDPLSSTFLAMKWPRILGLRDEAKKEKRPWLVEVRSAKWFILFVVSFAACTVSVPSHFLSRLTMLIIG